MSDGIYAALSGAVAQERSLDVVANNVANVGTTGFRGDRLAFQESLSRAPAGPTPQSLRYVDISRSQVDQTEGPLQQTGNPLDLAISGDGFFVVRTPNGDRYSRDGSFRVEPDGVLRTRQGYPLVNADAIDPNQTEIVIPPGQTPVTIGTDGSVMVGPEQLSVGRIRIDDVPNSATDLVHEGLTLLVPRPGVTPAAAPAANFTVNQGYLEGANVSAIGGMNELISANRSFDAFQRVIQAFRSIDERAVRDIASTR